MSYLSTMIQNLLRLAQSEDTSEPYYEVLQYIQLDGTQYFNTGFVATDITDNIVFNGRFEGITTSSATQIFCAVNSSGGGWFGIPKSTALYGLGNTSSSEKTNVAYNTDSLFYCKIERKNAGGTSWSATLDVDGSTATRSFSSGSQAQNTFSVLIGASCNSSSTDINFGSQVKIKCLKLHIDDVFVRDYIPVLDNQMRPCLYDKLTKTFLYAKKISDGTTTYDLGFKRWNKFDVDYIENTGTAYIPFASITPSTTMGMNIEYAYTTLSSSEPAGVIGTYNGDTQRKDTFFVSTSSGYTQKASSPSSASCGVMVFHRGGNVGTSSSTSASYVEPEKDVWYSATVNWLGDGKINWTNGSDELSADVGENAVVTNQLRLFSRCNSSNSTYNNCKSRVRKLQFSDGSNIIRSYKPTVWHNSDTTAIATLYDEVYNKMETPSGSLKAYILADNQSINWMDLVTDTTGAYIREDGVIEETPARPDNRYTSPVPVKAGEQWTLSMNVISGNKRIQGYSSTSTTSWVSQLGIIATTSTGNQSLTVTIPSGVNYIRISHSTNESDVTLINTTTYEVGSNCFVSPATASQQVTNNYFNTGLYGNEKWNVKLIAFTSTNVAGQLFGNFVSSSATNNLTINSGTATGTGTISRFDGQAMSQDKIINMGINQKSLLQMNKIGAWQDNTQVVAWNNPNSFTTTGTCYLCGTNGSATVRPNGCCYLVIDEDGTLVAEYIPVKNKTVTTQTGLYDRVSGTLNTGIGTHTFNSLS